jgi:hypothetical protein
MKSSPTKRAPPKGSPSRSVPRGSISVLTRCSSILIRGRVRSSKACAHSPASSSPPPPEAPERRSQREAQHAEPSRDRWWPQPRPPREADRIETIVAGNETRAPRRRPAGSAGVSLPNHPRIAPRWRPQYPNRRPCQSAAVISAAGQNLPPTTLPKTPAIGVEFSESCQRVVPKSCNFNGSADALGGRAFWNIKI